MNIYQKALERYFALTRTRPEEFSNNGEFDIILDYDTLLQYSQEHDHMLGVIYESKYHIFVVDLVRDKKGNVFPYERLLKTIPGGVVILTMHQGNFVLLKQYRHAMRTYQYAFPRGFAELNLTSVENAKKETSEELKSTTDNFIYLGTVIADSGVSGNLVQVYKCEIVDDIAVENVEGITGIIEVSEEEFRNMVYNHDITDGFTLAAITLYRSCIL